MDVIENTLSGIIPEEIISSDLVGFIEKQLERKQNFRIKSVKESTDPATILTAVAGYYTSYGVAYLSDPDSNQGLIGIDPKNKRLIVSPKDAAFFEHRDSVVYITPKQLLVRGTFNEVLREFANKSYSFENFSPHRPGEPLIAYTVAENIPSNGSLKLEEVLRR